MITLEIHQHQWIQGASDDPSDHCSHGTVVFQINGTSFVKSDDGVWTTSASALFLLRSLTMNHSPDDSVTEGNLIFPCCGFSVWAAGIKFKVLCMGCPSGIDVEIFHKGDKVTIQGKNGHEVVPLAEWRAAVLAFVDQVKAFYNRSTPKVIIDNDLNRDGWQAFWTEWEDRYASTTVSNV